MQRVKTSVIGWVERRIDSGITSAGETAKTFFVEAWRIVSRIFITWIAVLLGFLNKRAFEGWFTERRRIQQRPVPPSPNGDSFEEHTMTRFASLVDESDEHNLTALKSNPDLTTSSSPINGANSNNNNSAPNTKTLRPSRASSRARKIVPKIKYDKVDVNKDRIFSYEKVMTGFLEDLKMNAILGIDKIMNALRRWSKDFFTYLKNLTLTAILLAVLDPRRYWLRGVWVFSVFVAASKRVINFWRPSTWKAVPHKIVSKDRLDKRRMQEIVQSHGYPYEQYTVTTEDGYILTLERLPNRKSTKVLYLQHGVIDNSYTWFAHIQGQGALAFTAFDSGYDVFVGTLRGCQGSMKHVNPNIKAKEYWNFTVNEHGFYDFPAFMNKINELKNQELDTFSHPIIIDAETGQVHTSVSTPANNNNNNLNVPSLSPRRGSFRRSKSFPSNILQSIVAGEKVVELNDLQDEAPKESNTNVNTAEYRAKSKEALLGKKFEITVISHSMGAMATLMYLIKSRLDKKPHYVSRAILLSPAGLHKTAPKIVPIVGPILTVLLWILPIYSFRFPSEYVRVLFAKVMEDVNGSYSMRNLISYLLSKVVGGDSIEHTFVNVHNITYNIFSGTSAGVFKHFYQIYRKGRFMAYDYGKERNMREYGQREPIDFLANYDKIDIPIYFVMGLKDTLIEPVSIITHFSTLEDHHPNLAFLKAIPKLGHIDFTIGANEELISYILSILTDKNKASTIQ